MITHGLESSFTRHYLFTCVAALCAIFALALPASAAVVVSDGFGDADIDNNGIPLEDVDTNVGPTPLMGMGTPNTYVPARLEDAMGGGPENPEVTSVLDASDTGIRWFQSRGFTGGTTGSSPNAGTGQSKPTIRILDDTQGAMQETMATGLNIPAIDSGYAMSWESRGGGSSATGFFDETIELGPEVGDEVKVSFDFRLWRDAPNANTNVEPLRGEFRFGLFQDTDNQIGQFNNFAGRQVDIDMDGFVDEVPAQWGFEEGFFEGDLTGDKGPTDDVGANGDNGWTASVFMGDSLVENGGGSRIREELQADRLLQGSDVHTIAQPEDTTPEDPFNETFDFVTLENDKVYNLSLSLVRATEVDPGDTITATLEVIDKATLQSWSLTGTETLEDSTSGGIPIPGTGGIQSDSWDYFAMRNATSGVSEYDFIFDNFLVEVFGSNEPTGPFDPADFNDDGKVDLLDLDILGTNFGTMGDQTMGDANGDGNIDLLDLDILGANFGNMAMPSAAVPEPGAVLLTTAALISGCLLGSGRRRS